MDFKIVEIKETNDGRQKIPLNDKDGNNDDRETGGEGETIGVAFRSNQSCFSGAFSPNRSHSKHSAIVHTEPDNFCLFLPIFTNFSQKSWRRCFVSFPLLN